MEYIEFLEGYVVFNGTEMDMCSCCLIAVRLGVLYVVVNSLIFRHMHLVPAIV